MEMQLSEEAIKIAQSLGLTFAILIIFAIFIGISLFIFTRFYKWLIKNNFIEPKEKNHE